MTKRTSLPVALTIAGSDSGGGAGIQADLKTFAALGVHGASAVTCLTAQNPKGVAGIQAVKPQMVLQQIEAVFAELPPTACKTGMLFTVEIVRVVSAFFRAGQRPLLIVDPVMVATSGAPLLKPSAVRALQEELLPAATLVTPNLHETELLLQTKIQDEEDQRAAAREIYRRFGCAVLVKGGHLKQAKQAVDVFFDGKKELRLAAPFVRGVTTHGTGCTFSAAVTAFCARGRALPQAVQEAKQFITQAIARNQSAGGHFILNWFGRR